LAVRGDPRCYFPVWDRTRVRGIDDSLALGRVSLIISGSASCLARKSMSICGSGEVKMFPFAKRCRKLLLSQTEGMNANI
jgi:hypothetical protein